MNDTEQRGGWITEPAAGRLCAGKDFARRRLPMSWGRSRKWDRWLAGVALSRNEGMGVYAGSESGTGGDPRLTMRSPAGSEYED